MSFYIGDLVRSVDNAATGKVIDRLTWNEIVLVAFEGRPGLPIWIDVRLLEHVGAIIFSLDEPTNYDERLAWWRELVPIYQGVPARLCCTTEILVSTFTAWDCELLPVDASAVTVEADGDVAITCDLPHYPWQRFGGPGRWDNTFIDHIPPVKWYRVEHGELSHVASCEVTL